MPPGIGYANGKGKLGSRVGSLGMGGGRKPFKRLTASVRRRVRPRGGIKRTFGKLTRSLRGRIGGDRQAKVRNNRGGRGTLRKLIGSFK